MWYPIGDSNLDIFFVKSNINKVFCGKVGAFFLIGAGVFRKVGCGMPNYYGRCIWQFVAYGALHSVVIFAHENKHPASTSGSRV